tara:strand:- start:237 stop:500 length:264 start_codon:yes stop_codon:yes gene_type:complete
MLVGKVMPEVATDVTIHRAGQGFGQIEKTFRAEICLWNEKWIQVEGLNPLRFLREADAFGADFLIDDAALLRRSFLNLILNFRRKPY